MSKFENTENYGGAPKVRASVCRVCGCTDADCSRCVESTGAPCWWVEDDLCSACVKLQETTDGK